jgi:PAS domain S-box-containing protein
MVHPGSLLKSAVALILSVVLWWAVASWYEQRLLADTRQRVQSGLIPYGSGLTTAMNERLALLSGLEAFVLANMADRDLGGHFEAFAAGLYTGKEGIRALQVFPPRGPVRLYPVVGNQATVGRTLRDLVNDERAEVRADVGKAIASRRITLSGPYELRQSGLGLVARLAIYHEEKLWGLAVIVFDLPPILKLAGLDPSPHDLNVGLRDEKGRVFAGDPAVFGADPVIHEIILPDRTWQLAAVAPGGWERAYVSDLRSFQGVGMLPVVLLVVLAYALSNQRARLRHLVAVRTEALKESEERFRAMFEQAPLGVALIDSLTGRIDEVNPRFAEIAGRTREEMTSIDWKALTHPDDGKEDSDRMALLNSGTVPGLKMEKRCVHPDGSHIWINLTIAPLTVASKERPRHLCMIEDITDRKRAEEEREKLHAQLVHAQKMESVCRLAGGVAHDFNNMLGVILGHAEIAMDQVDPAEPLFTDLREIRRAAERSADLTRQLLAFARKQTVAPRVLDLNETVEGMLKMLQRLIGEDIDLAWLPGTSVWPVKVDPAQIDQVLANLCVNARDAIAGVGKVTIETENVSFDEAYCAEHPGFVPGDFVLLAVSDDGCGMDQETRGKIFEPFFTTKGVSQGTGLGLATVYGIVKQNNGFINVYSEPGKGTTFKIYLSRHAAEADQIRKESPVPPAARGHETILLVEDEPAILKMATMMLERQGYRVLAASAPGEAVRVAGEHAGEIHLLMTDVVMPEMNGRDLAKNLMSLYPDLMCLFMSGYTANVIAHRGVLDEGVHFIQKPFSMLDLAAKVREVLDGK